jgi:hypothetical protein
MAGFRVGVAGAARTDSAACGGGAFSFVAIILGNPFGRHCAVALTTNPDQSSDMPLRANQTRKANQASVTKPPSVATMANAMREALGGSEGSRNAGFEGSGLWNVRLHELEPFGHFGIGDTAGIDWSFSA